MSAEHNERRFGPRKIAKTAVIGALAVTGVVVGYEVLFGQEETHTHLECLQSVEVNMHKAHPALGDVVNLMEKRDANLKKVDGHYLEKEAARFNPDLTAQDQSFKSTPVGSVTVPVSCTVRQIKSYDLGHYPGSQH